MHAEIKESNEAVLCAVCGGRTFSYISALTDELTAEWDLSRDEREYIDRQQGLQCTTCGSNLRSVALAASIVQAVEVPGPLAQWATNVNAQGMQILEINEAGGLHPILVRMAGHQFVAYPEFNMLQLELPSESYDLVIHSDTLEHVSDPVQGLRECRRVLRPGGTCCFTVPVIVGRLSRSRDGLPPSYHGAPGECRPDMLVYTEFGSDVWRFAIEAGFKSCTIDVYEYPAALAIRARR